MHGSHDPALESQWRAEAYIVPVPGTHAMHRAVALVSGGLNVQLIEALRDWPVPNTS
jgi:hypothetical protein